MIFFVVASSLLIIYLNKLSKSTTIKGLWFVTLGFALIMLNIFIGSLFHSTILPESILEKFFPVVGFLSGYIGQTVGFLLLIIGIYKVVHSLIPQLSEHYSSLVEHSLVGVYLIQDHVLKFANPQLASIFGYEREELLGKNLLDLVAPESRKLVEENVKKRLSGEVKSINYQFKGLRKNGEIIDVEVYGTRTIYQGKPAVHGTLLDITERKKAEKALQETRRYFEDLVESIGGIVWEAQVNPLKFTFVSKQAERLLGYPVDKWLESKKFWESHIHPDDREWAVQYCAQATAELRDHAFEYRMIAADGHIVWLRDIVTVLVENGKAVKLRGVMIDLTHRKETEEKLEKSVALLRSTLESTADGILVVDTDGKIVTYNKKFQDMWKIPDQVLESKDDQKAIEFVLDQLKEPESFLEKIKELYISEKESYDILEFKDGRVFERYSHPHKIGGKYVGRVWSFRDVTQKKRAEDALRASEEKYRTIFEESRDVIFVATPQGKLIDINKAGVELFGFDSKEELLKVNIAQDLFVNPSDRDKLVEKLLKQGYVQNYELILKKKTGETLYVLSTATAVKDENGHFVTIRGILHDETERRKLEEQLLQAQKMETIGTLAGGIAHDFNNLLTAILGNAELGLNDARPGDPVYQDLLEIEKAALQAQSLTNRLLSFSRKQPMNPQPLNLNKIVEDFVVMLKRIIGEDIELEIDLSTQLQPIYGDPAQLQQVLLNLAVNARDAMPHGGKFILKTEWVKPDHIKRLGIKNRNRRDYVKLVVSDNGSGMTSEVKARIFEPFFTTKEVGKGTGLGLSVVYGIIKQHQGFIEVDSEIDKGTTFSIYFPVHSDDHKAKVKMQKQTHLHKGHGTILVVEDEEAVLKVAVRILQSLGYQLITARNGEEALNVFNQKFHDIDLVIMDIVMPHLNGPETYRHMLKIKPDLPVLFVTGYDVFADLDELSSINNHHMSILQKPYSAEILSRKISELIKQDE
ncbi:MAG: PAS domain S-box protein [Calditrichaeota bacterium]|nr:MAG: PAS domain S-box protein [Calditrichota bacterium]